jgi:imidazolonepropionase-like amidohydrolase
MRLALCFWLLALASGAEEVRYRVLMAGNPAGAQVTTIEPGELRFRFEFNDRGRGPRLESRIRLAADGTPVLVETRGNDYLKKPVDERFSVTERRASWKNSAEKGDQALSTPAFYVSFSGVPEELALLARALLLAPGGELSLLPGGSARIEKVGERDLVVGDDTERVVHYAISGLDFSPTSVWLDARGRFFFTGSSWTSVVREGWESAVLTLLAAQDQATAAREASRAQALARRPGVPVVFHGANLFDAVSATIQPRMSVVVTGNRITAVGKDGSIAILPGAELIDATGKTLIPGLADMHAHVDDDAGLLNIAAGVTSVRDLANDIDKLADLRGKWDDGRAIGPRIVVAAGFIDGPGPYAGPSKVLVATPEEGRAAIARYSELGYPHIKLYSSLKPELVPGLIDQAHGLGMRVSGHIPAFMTAEECVRLGYDEIQHVNMLFLNFWADTVKDTRTPLRFTAVAEKAAELDLGSERVLAFVRLLKERGTTVDPTVGIFVEMFSARPGTLAPGDAVVADRLPAQVRRGMLGGGLPVPEGMDQRYRDSSRALLRMVKLLYDRGIPIVAGTDGANGFNLYRELELYVEAGIPAPKVLQIATLGAARVMKHDPELGSISADKKADLVLLDGDPTTNISAIRKPVIVVKDGIFYSPRALYGALGVKP